MSYLEKSDRDWGVAIATFLAVPLGLAWTVVSLIGGSLVCADETAHCSGVLWPLLGGIAIIVSTATITGWLINLVIRVMSRNR